MHSILHSNSFIHNHWVEGTSNEVLAVYDKYSHGLLSEITLLSSTQIEDAIEKSWIAFSEYKKTDLGFRSERLEKLACLLQDNKESLASLICAEAGKPINYARAEVDRAISTTRFGASEALRICGETIAMNFGNSKDLEAYTKRFPIGVIACICPFNFPLNLALHKIVPALASGNVVIVKPSPYAPLTALALAGLVKAAGFPESVCNVVVCDNAVANSLITDEKIKMLSFTGSPLVGWALKAKVGKKKVALELGGNASVIIDRTADIEDACTKIINGAFLYSGQICISTQRIYVDSVVYDDFIDRLLDLCDEIQCGDPRNEKVIVGPLIDEVHVTRIHSWVKEAVAAGAEVLYGGHILDEEHNIYAPTILTNTTPDMKIVSEEVFGPVVIIERTDFFDEAIELVNESKFGLQCGLFTNQIDQMKYAFERIEVGGLIINNVPGFRADHMPYGGVKDSGLGREGIKYTIAEMTEPKLLVY